MGIKLIEKPSLGSLISPHSNTDIPIHNWFSYKHGYSRDLALYLVNNFGLREGSWVLDPFCGGGTTLLTCKELGINARGYDILPFAVFLSNVKVQDYNIVKLEQQVNIVTETWKNNDVADIGKLPNIPLVNKAFNPEIGMGLLKLKHAINSIVEEKVRSFLNLGFLNILESVSNTSKTGGFLRIVQREVSLDMILDLFLMKVYSMIKDVAENQEIKMGSKVNVAARIGDARRLPARTKYDAVITSPPYPNRHDYTRIYSLEMIFDFVSSNDELKKIRYDTLRSHVEARKKYEVSNYDKPSGLDKLITKIRSNGTNNVQVITMLEGYFEDMHLCLSEIQRCLKRGGKVALVVSNVRFSGINIPVDELLFEVGARTGLEPIEIWAVRYRGNSSQQMKNYGRLPTRESIVFWRNND